jgi:hypothetical protein
MIRSLLYINQWIGSILQQEQEGFHIKDYWKIKIIVKDFLFTALEWKLYMY